MQRLVQPELLDQLQATDPEAIQSRKDLQRVNRIMGQAGIIRRLMLETCSKHRAMNWIELGAGDGTLLLSVVRKLQWNGLRIQLIDQQALVQSDTQAAFAELGCEVETVTSDVFQWLDRQPLGSADLVMANLFLHHFDKVELSRLLHLVAERSRCFVACEPRRSLIALTASRGLGMLGCNAVTRHDAVVSVRAGFHRSELSAEWPSHEEWDLSESSAGLFSHAFVALRRA